jgi:hypothetical protein
MIRTSGVLAASHFLRHLKESIPTRTLFVSLHLAIGDGSEEVYSDIGAFLMPQNCILAGATVALGYGIGKYFVMQGVE